MTSRGARPTVKNPAVNSSAVKSPTLKSPTIKSLVLRYLDERRPAVVDERVLSSIEAEVRKELGRQRPVSRSYLLDVLSGTTVEISRSLGGLPVDLRHRVHFADADQAAASLLDMQREYEAARNGGAVERARDVRRAVRKSKDRLRLLPRRPGLSPDKRREKQELLEWFLVWLENPEVFAQWIELRRRSSGEASEATSEAAAGRRDAGS